MRAAWWWHTAGMLWLLPFYSVIALTLWQRPSRQPLGRRALWSGAMTIAALSVIGLPAFVVFSRRWYWLYRADSDPELRGVGAREDGPASGYLAWFASTGASLTDGLVGRSPATPPPPPPPPLPDQWQALVTEAAAGGARLRAAASRATGPSAAAIARAAEEADQATAAVASVARHAAEVEAARLRIDVATIERRLAALDGDDTDTDIDIDTGTDDVGATRRSLEAQLATRRRMDDRMIRLKRQLERTAAQISEAAAQAEELSVYSPDVDAGSAPLTAAVDGLTGMREALEEVDRTR